MCKFDANRCGFHDQMADNLSVQRFDSRWTLPLSFFELNTIFFQRILYLNSAKDNIMQLMCKFEANRCGFCVAEKKIDLSELCRT